MGKPHLLWDELAAATPYLGVLKLLGEVLMDLLTYASNTAAITLVCQHNRIAEIWKFFRLLCVYPDQIQLVPNLFEKHVEVELHVATDNHGVGAASQIVYFLHRNGVDLVIAVQATHILSVS